MPPDEGLRPFYEEHYAGTGDAASEARRWRTVSAVAKAEHVSTLLTDLGSAGVRLLDIGCGDGAVLEAIAGDRPEWKLAGVEIAQRAADIAAERCPDAEIQRYDGTTLPFDDGAFDVGVLSHVLEHVTDPIAVLREAARACRVVVVEVPLEANLSTRRASKRAIAEQVGHIQRLSRADLHRIAQAAGLTVTRDLSDPLTQEVQAFFAASRSQRAKALIRTITRNTLHRVSAGLAQRVFTVHYACRCERAS
jgi:ubiquinone/menaquinone biosynthesis C-methylase UbiE